MKISVRRSRVSLRKQPTISNSDEFEKLKSIIMRYKYPTADTKLLESALNEFRKQNADLTVSEAFQKIKNTLNEAERRGTGDRVAMRLYSSIDFNQMLYDEYARDLEIASAPEKAGERVRESPEKKEELTEIDKRVADLEIRIKNIEKSIEQNRNIGKQLEQLTRAFDELEKTLNELKQRTPKTASDIEQYEDFVEKLGEMNRLTEQQITTLKSMYNKNRSLSENIDMAMKAVSAMNRQKEQHVGSAPQAKPEQQTSPWMWRSYRRGVEVPIPQECKIIKAFDHGFEADQYAEELVSQNPDLIIAVAYDWESGKYVVLECSRVPGNAINKIKGVYLLKSYSEEEE
mgnify:CR=1 FL=1